MDKIQRLTLNYNINYPTSWLCQQIDSFENFPIRTKCMCWSLCIFLWLCKVTHWTIPFIKTLQTYTTKCSLEMYAFVHLKHARYYNRLYNVFLELNCFNIISYLSLWRGLIWISILSGLRLFTILPSNNWETILS